ncbi:MAG: pseudaminic acid synthase [Lentisphaeraceae bacterium]|nr:pseudaminic acid synthase [Lentisphaeraceae bacterium]
MSSKSFEIDGRFVGTDYPPYIISELSANHNGDIDRAFEILEKSKKAGADAVKLQTYTADTITLKSNKPEFKIKGGLWDGNTLYELYEKAHLPWDWHKPLFEKASELDFTIFSSPFDFTAVDFLESLNAPAYKIASFECIDLPLIKYVAQTGKPMIISTGMANKEEIQEAVDCARSNGCENLVVLHCVSGYPAPPNDYNLKTLNDMSDSLNCLVGLSDHTISNTTAITSVALGACVIEKHVTLDRNAGGPDDSFSLVPEELESLCINSKIAWEALGRVDYSHKSSEKSNIIFRRSLYVTKNLKKGDVLSTENLRSVRPGYGLAPKFYEDVLGKKVCVDIEENSPLTWEHFS